MMGISAPVTRFGYDGIVIAGSLRELGAVRGVFGTNFGATIVECFVFGAGCMATGATLWRSASHAGVGREIAIVDGYAHGVSLTVSQRTSVTALGSMSRR